MGLYFHADDYGMTRGITDNILDCYDNGVLSGTSIIANGYAFDHAIAESKMRPGLRLSIHLNLLQGNPVAAPQDVGMLVNEEGRFYHSFLSLWVKYLTSSKRNKAVLKEQIRTEVSAQIEKVTNCFDSRFRLNLDSHNHFHVLPFFFDALLELHETYAFSYIRVPSEPFYFIPNGFDTVKAYLGANLIKHLLLKTLGKRCKRLLQEVNINTCQCFIGVLFTGMMTEKTVRAILQRFSHLKGSEGISEILLHPGGALEAERKFWNHYPRYRRYYFSAYRQLEHDTLTRCDL